MKKNYEIKGMSYGGCQQREEGFATTPGCYRSGCTIESPKRCSYHEQTR